MADYLTVDGLEIPTLDDLRTIIGEEQRASIDPLLANDSDSVLGMLNAIVASHSREAWEALQAINPADPAELEGVALETVCALTGTIRGGPTKSIFGGTRRLAVSASPGATVTAGATKFAVTGSAPPILFTATETVSNLSIVPATIYVAAECDEYGPVSANAGTVTTIATPTAGILSVSNPYDAIKGTDGDTDAALRNRREKELRDIGSCTPGAIRSAFLNFTKEDGSKPITAAFVLENTSEVTDANLIPPHGYQVVFWDGGSAPVTSAEALALSEANRPAGTFAWAPVRATSRPVEIRVTLTYQAANYVGDVAVKSAIADLFASYQVPADGSGSGLVPWSVYVAAVQALTGVVSVSLYESRFQGSATWLAETNLTPATKTIATTDTTLITVISTAV